MHHRPSGRGIGFGKRQTHIEPVDKRPPEATELGRVQDPIGARSFQPVRKVIGKLPRILEFPPAATCFFAQAGQTCPKRIECRSDRHREVLGLVCVPVQEGGTC